jgi:RNA-directed DNA polymerase
MDWANYFKEFTTIAINKGFNDREINEFHHYAKKLYDKNLTIIFSPNHFAHLVGYKLSFLYRIANSQIHFYRTFEIPKKNGQLRKISEPLPSLKEIQKWILENILEKCEISPYAKAFIKNRSIRENARFHSNQEILLTLDIRDFFQSIKSKSIYKIFVNLGYTKNLSVLLTNICTLNGELPQGAPTSPYLSNLFFKRIDSRIFGFTNKHKIRYTRYADDMTFSGDFEPGMVINFIKKILSNYNLEINDEKIRVRKKHQQQEVTGIVVNNKLMQSPKSLRKEIRKEMYYIEKYGLDSHLEKINCYKANYVKHLLGLINFVHFVNPKDTYADKYKKLLLNYLK